MMRERRRIRDARRALGAGEQRAASRSLCRRLSCRFTPTGIRDVAFYLPFDGEISVVPLMLRWHEIGRRLYLPRVRDDNTLAFERYVPGATPLVRNRYGVPEPAPAPEGTRNPHWLHMICVPLIGFDRRGNRLGMGKGYYDRTLADLARRFRRPVLVGVAHHFQETTLEPQPWDVPVDIVATDRELIDLRYRAPDRRR